jgi:hypothetical protein
MLINDAAHQERVEDEFLVKALDQAVVQVRLEWVHGVRGVRHLRVHARVCVALRRRGRTSMPRVCERRRYQMRSINRKTAKPRRPTNTTKKDPCVPTHSKRRSLSTYLQEVLEEGKEKLENVVFLVRADRGVGAQRHLHVQHQRAQHVGVAHKRQLGLLQVPQSLVVVVHLLLLHRRLGGRRLEWHRQTNGEFHCATAADIPPHKKQSL